MRIYLSLTMPRDVTFGTGGSQSSSVALPSVILPGVLLTIWHQFIWHHILATIWHQF